MTSTSSAQQQLQQQRGGTAPAPATAAAAAAATWSSLRGAVRESRRAFAGPGAQSIRCPTNFAFRTFSDVLRTRLYFLSSQSAGKESTLLYVDVDDSSPGTPSDAPLPWNALIESTFQVCPSSKVSKEAGKEAI
jgi:hypothetical protein